MQDRKIALVTGAATGFGLLTSVELAKAGYEVWATMRDPSKKGDLEKAAREAGVPSRITVERLDVNDQASVDACAAKVHAQVPSLALLVNNAGFGMSGFAEDVSIDELKKQLETNFFGAVRTTKAFLGKMREQGDGLVVNVTSGWGRIGPPGSSSYAASKWALEGWSESLHFEVRRHGVRVVLVEPGAFKTEIWNKRLYAEGARSATSVYRERQDRLEVRTAEYLKTLTSEPIAVAHTIARVAQMRRPALRYPVGNDVRFGLALRKLLPESVFLWLFGTIMDRTLG